MEFLDVLINVLALFVGLGAYIMVMKTPFGKRHEDLQFPIMLGAVIVAVIVGGIIRMAAAPLMTDERAGADTLTAKAAAIEIPALSVEEGHLVDPDGDTVILKGVSTHGLSFTFWNNKGKETRSSGYINEGALKMLRDDWHANVIRLAVYTEEYNGYCSGSSDNRKTLLKTVDEGVRLATEQGMYVIIDWHILSDGNPNSHKKEAKAFFKRMAKKYADYTNVLYEICNEPNGNVTWKKDIKPYAKTIIKTIRKYDKDAVVIVGTPTWSQDVDAVIESTLSDKNTMYALHFYAATHGQYLMDKAQKAIDAGVPLFITECNITEASGDGRVDKTTGNKWMKFIRENDISFVCWNLSNKAESCALIKQSCTKYKNWKVQELSATGKWFRKQMRK